MKRIATTLLLTMIVATAIAQMQNIITIPTPPRPSGQEDCIAMRAPALETVHIGIIGLGMRGPGAVTRLSNIPGAEVVALCDIEQDRVTKAQKLLTDAGKPKAVEYSGSRDAWKQLCQRNDIDLVYVATDWKMHAEIGVYAMEHGKHVAIEVPAAMNLNEIWQLINTSERTRKHCMQLENCVYDFFELTSLNMAQQGLFGDIVHVEGSYIHNLEEFWPYYYENWRMDYNRSHKGDIYATHGMGPACQLLNMHRGDRMTTLVAMDTKSVHGAELVEQRTGERCDNFRNGDHTTTLIRTAKGKVIEIQHNTMTPQPYNRLYQLTGTKGFANKYPIEGYAVDGGQLVESGVIPKADNISGHSFLPKAEKKALEDKYEHPILKKYGAMAKEVGGHGGMDFIMDARLVYCLQNGLPLDMDVYDLAEWCCLAELGSLSMDNGCAPVEVPDFTRGHWEDVDGYRHAFASAADEAAAEAAAKAATAKLKASADKQKSKKAKKAKK